MSPFSLRRRPRATVSGSTLSLVKYLPYVPAVAAVAFGAVLLYLGEIDDSPGLGGIGLILIVAAVFFAVRHARKTRRG